MRSTILALAITSIACGPEVVDAQDKGATGDESPVAPRDEYMAFDVRYPQGSTPDAIVLVWGLEVAAVGTDDELELGWCEAEAARQVADYGAVIVRECEAIDGLWRIPRADGLSAGTFRTEAECRATPAGVATCEYVAL
jgi:hypothetical protein